MKKIYVAVPVSGDNYIDQRNHAFVIAANLGQKDYNPISTFDVVPKVEDSYNEALGMEVKAMLDCDVIYLCRDWNKSRACRALLQVALIYGKDVMTE